MRTAVDTNVLLDVFLPDPKFGSASKKALESSDEAGSLIISDIVYGELAGFFPSRKMLDEALDVLGIQFVSCDKGVCYLAGETWKKYRKSGGKRHRILSDFLIAAHAQMHADQFLTRDRGFYRKYFSRLVIVEP